MLRVADIIESDPALRKAVVLSACRGVTDALLTLVALAERQDRALEDRIQEVYDAAWAYAAPHFQAEVDRLEAVRKAMAGPE